MIRGWETPPALRAISPARPIRLIGSTAYKYQHGFCTTVPSLFLVKTLYFQKFSVFFCSHKMATFAAMSTAGGFLKRKGEAGGQRRGRNVCPADFFGFLWDGEAWRVIIADGQNGFGQRVPAF